MSLRQSHCAHRAKVLAGTKAPAGKVRTRLTMQMTADQAARVAATPHGDTLADVRRTGSLHAFRVVDGVVPDVRFAPTAALRTLDMPVAASGDDARQARPRPRMLIGMDMPELTAALRDRRLGQPLRDGTDAVIGAGTDGEWRALRLRRPQPALTPSVPTSREDTSPLQPARLVAPGLDVPGLLEVRHVDRPVDLRTGAALGPAGGAAAAVSRVLE